jgi:hypothetical protein
LPRDWPNDTTQARRVLQASIEQGMGAVLGKSGLDMITRSAPLEVLASDPRKLHEILVSIFTKKGALIIEREIARSLLDALGEATHDAADQVGANSAVDNDLERQRNVVRLFAKVAALPKGHLGLQQTLSAASGKGAVSFFESAAKGLADAFTK